MIMKKTKELENEETSVSTDKILKIEIPWAKKYIEQY